MEKYLKEFFSFISCIFIFLVYNEVTLRFIDPLSLDKMALAVQPSYWNIPWMLVNVVVLSYGFVSGFMFVELFEAKYYPERERAWYVKFFKGLGKRKVC